MLTQTQEIGLTQAYWIIQKTPGWYSDCHEAGYSEEELQFMEMIDGYQSVFQEKIDIWERDIDKDISPDIHFEINVNTKIKLLSKKINTAWDKLSELRKTGIDYASREVAYDFLSIKRMEKVRNRIRAGQCHKPSKFNNNVTNEQIVKARQFPLENLVEVGKQGRVICPWHDDKRPSAIIKNGFFFCFTCNEWSDSIKWMMEIEGMSFHDAVRRLS